MRGPDGPYKIKAIQHYVIGKSGECGVAVYDPKGFTHCIIRKDVEDAVHRIIDGCANPFLDIVEGWTDIRHAPGGGRRVVQIYKLKADTKEEDESEEYYNAHLI